jgi:hypothetical protein
MADWAFNMDMLEVSLNLCDCDPWASILSVVFPPNNCLLLSDSHRGQRKELVVGKKAKHEQNVSISNMTCVCLYSTSYQPTVIQEFQVITVHRPKNWYTCTAPAWNFMLLTMAFLLFLLVNHYSRHTKFTLPLISRAIQSTDVNLCYHILSLRQVHSTAVL